MTIWVAAGAVVMETIARKAAANGEAAKKTNIPSPTRSAVSPISTTLIRKSDGPLFLMLSRLKLPPIVKTISPRTTSCNGARDSKCPGAKSAGSPRRSPAAGPANSPATR